ncbi:GTP-binding protein [gamma proteobacterium HTCC2207]|uniref:GTPase HflX n=1 Tax=gamma proteobacterium HTCC2207 TaxID=314287 RepID=Q1YRY6_9GAMM|nr:GTP-binding protein [gamma proteobacterium HTCC2207]MBT5105808.1 GTPase HflX [Porticoccaceae bacterium]MBT6593903.1 GTPase HflX [Porticoccaceae bacterium]MDB4427419.1 GTPase HflX [Porticoccaceae bacterium]MDC0517078.1 GTPase HflX [Porticoccaceae bacterium]
MTLFFERPEFGERAVLVTLKLQSESEPEDPREFEELVLSAGGDPVEVITGSRSAPHAKLFVGTGKLEEIAAAVNSHCAELVIFNHNLSPSQERNIEAELKCRVLDRTGLILDIFAQRARTHEGKLQVELAQLQHLSTRLVRGWTHLERQRGGIGMRGPGETQLESDRRMVRDRIKSIQSRLLKVRKQRAQGRRARVRAEVPAVSLVGYTNAGKSTLFNNLTQADVFVANQLFATLDPTMRKLEVPEQGEVVFADTVGFISHLPHRLVDAFRATLEEAANATLLLHVVDGAAEDRATNIKRVEEVLKEIDAHKLPTLMVYNKVDLLEDFSARIDRNAEGQPVAVWLSALKNEGLDLLLQAVAERLPGQFVHKTLRLKPDQGALRASLYSHKAVLDEQVDENGWINVEIKLSEIDFLRLIKSSGLNVDDLVTV